MCIGGEHQVGQIGSKTVHHSEWDDAVIAFGLAIDDFNIRGQRQQVNHPGWCTKFKFCPQCGNDLRGLDLRDFVINS
jgi:hypothetical protein